MKKLKKYFERLIVNQLISGGALAEKDINTQSRTLNFGLWSVATYFFSPKDNLLIWVLVNWYNYKCYETTILPAITWCGLNADNVNKRFEVWNEEWNQKLKSVQSKRTT